ncbi:MAG: serine hydrolase, partial [Myxococcales bacterium]|nr:serine hydrolase [Myxococcales bacterium]
MRIRRIGAALMVAVTLGWVGASCVRRPFIVAVPVRTSWPDAAWPEATPERRGLDSAVLADAIRYVRDEGLAVHGVVLVRGGDVVLDARFYPYGDDVPHDVASVTKSVTATLLGLAIADGFVPGLDARVADYFPEHARAFADARKKAMTVGDLAAMRSGFACGHDPSEPETRRMVRAPNFVNFALALPMERAPDDQFSYCSPGVHLLGAAIARAVGEDLEAYARRRLFEPLGVRDLVWPHDAQGFVHGAGDLRLRPRDLARLGWLYLNDGRWGGRALLPAGWVEQATRWRSRVEGPLGYGLGWWLVDEEGFRRFEARGRGGQLIVAWPEGDLVAVLLGAGYEGTRLGEFLRRALRSNGLLRD